MKTEVVIVSAARSAVGRGKKDGALATVHPVDLSAAVMRAIVDRAGVDGALIDDVIWGCAMPEAAQGLNHARLAALRAQLPVEVSAMTVNRFCLSGLQSIALGAQAILSGMNDVILAGGIEMMSAVPMSGYHTRLHPELTEAHIGMGFTAERVSKRWGITREMQDAFAFGSQQKAAAAQKSGVFATEIVPIPVERATWKGAKKSSETVTFAADEMVRVREVIDPRPDRTAHFHEPYLRLVEELARRGWLPSVVARHARRRAQYSAKVTSGPGGRAPRGFR